MTKARYEIAPQYIRAEQRRQRYLDYFNANPGKTAPDLKRYMTETFGDSATTCNTTRQMIALGELRAVKGSQLWRYYPTATKTMQAVEFSIKQRTAAKRRMDEIHGNEVKPLKADEPWRYIHRPGKQIREAGGQGCLRNRVYVGAVGVAA